MAGEGMLQFILMWPMKTLGAKPPQYMAAAAGAGAMYYWLGGQFAGQDAMMLAQAYALGGLASYAVMEYEQKPQSMPGAY